MGRKKTMRGRPEQLDGHDRFVHQWTVPSETDPSKTYLVSIDDNGNFLCSCPRFKFEKKPIPLKTPCKHILAVQAMQRGRPVADVQISPARKAWITRRKGHN